jgi:hypothetical protein
MKKFIFTAVVFISIQTWSQTIYTANGTLTANRTVNLGGRTLNFTPNSSAPTTGNLFINNLGYVGLGTNTPIYRLQINNGDVAINPGKLLIGPTFIDNERDWGIQSSKPIIVYNSEFPLIQITGGDNATYHSSIQAAIATGDYFFSNNAKKGDAVVKGLTAGNFIIANEGGGGLKFTTKVTFSDIAKVQMFINNFGNIGIGTETPDAKLAVNGLIHTKEVKVDLIGWPDYVFKPNYNLLPLKEVENQIKATGHLPNVPNAKTVETDGLKLGEMNKILMEKVEELTLYIIQLNKKVEKLEKKSKTKRP